MIADKGKISLREICKSIVEECQILGAIGGYVLTASPVDDAEEHSISFCSGINEDALAIIRNSKAGAIICSDQLKLFKNDYSNKTLILVSNPRLTFVRVLQKYFRPEIEFGISPTAVIEKGARIHPDTYIGPHCFIGKCQIEEGTIIHGNVYIYPGVTIGKGVLIQAGTVIGSEGIGYANDEEGVMEPFPHVGGVTIEDNVWMGANVTIMRGLLSNTVIGRGTWLGPQSSIGHQVIIGKHCIIYTRSLIGGSCHIGDYTHISLAACVRDRITIGNNVKVGMGSVVTRDIGDGWVVYGVPAKEIRKTR